MKYMYKQRNFTKRSLLIIDQANEIIEEYQNEGYVLTLRQLYYQFVARDLLPNSLQNYKNLGNVISDARVAGMIDWDAIEDRTRNLQRLSTWGSPSSIIDTCAQQFKFDLWATQRFRPEVWIEKEALAGVFERTCVDLRVPFIACRGYMSISEMRVAAERFIGHLCGGQIPVVLHFGDHDPSGIDMSRDIQDRLQLFMGYEFENLQFARLALNLEQVRKLNPPPNPAKMTDARFGGYVEKYGTSSWELDALDPRVLDLLVRTFIDGILDHKMWNKEKQKEDKVRRRLGMVAKHWDYLKW